MRRAEATDHGMGCTCCWLMFNGVNDNRLMTPDINQLCTPHTVESCLVASACQRLATPNHLSATSAAELAGAETAGRGGAGLTLRAFGGGAAAADIMNKLCCTGAPSANGTLGCNDLTTGLDGQSNRTLVTSIPWLPVGTFSQASPNKSFANSNTGGVQIGKKASPSVPALPLALAKPPDQASTCDGNE
jgi:hypothetical protein